MQTISNYNKSRLRITDALTDFETQIKNLTNDLEIYKQKENANERLVFHKQQQINSLKNTIDLFIEFQESSTFQMISYAKEISKLNTTIFKLEGICLLHGISNLGYYLRMKKDVLIFTVKEAFQNGFRQTPIELLPEIDNQTTKENFISPLVNKAKQLNNNGK
ncbi:MAG: hypothetical protein K0R26_14 [Bacteroidota bacterium]|jgi:hypothetical protein|nr:hypothetical protein [Bacteroidota bacterium]